MRRQARNRGQPRLNECFIPGDGINREVITTEIWHYLGPNALVRPGYYEDPQSGLTVQGYYINADKSLTTAMIQELQVDSASWEAERRAQMARSFDAGQYRFSETHQSRQIYRAAQWPLLPKFPTISPTSNKPRFLETDAPGYSSYDGNISTPLTGSQATVPQYAEFAPPQSLPHQPTAPGPGVFKNVLFELLSPIPAQNRDRSSFFMQIYPHDTADSIVTNVKVYYGLHSGPSESKSVRFHDELGNNLIARYDCLQDHMVVYVRVIEDSAEHTVAVAPSRSLEPIVGVGSVGSRYDEEGNWSVPESSVFDRAGGSRATRPTTVATSQPKTNAEVDTNGPLARVTPGMGTEAEQHSGGPPISDGGIVPSDCVSAENDVGKDACTQDLDAETSYSLDSTLDDSKLYLQAFSDHLSRDLCNSFNDSMNSGIEPDYLEAALKKFAWKLHEESSNPFQWEACVTLHRRRKEIVELLSRTAYVEDGAEVPGENASVSEVETGEKEPKREPFQKPTDITLNWLSGVELSPDHDYRSEYTSRNVDNEPLIADDEPLTADDEPLLFQIADYEHFVRNSGAYQWLVSRLRQHTQLRWGNPDSMSEIGTEIRNRLRALYPLRKISRQRRLSVITMTFNLDWNPVSFFRDQGLDPTLPAVLDRVLCLTGTLCEAQATTVVEYMTQTWPETGEPVLNLIRELVALPEKVVCSYELPKSYSTQDRHDGSVSLPKSNIPQLRARIDGPSSCSICVTGGPYFVSEIAEQLGWLASTLRCSPATGRRGVVTCTPSVKDIKINVGENEVQTAAIGGSCRVVFSFKQDTDECAAVQPEGFCWGLLFWSPILVSGYPILRRPEPNTGLEMSLQTMALLIRSQQVVQWGERIIMKGFSSLVVATLATAGVIVWHLLVSESPDERISYTDPEMDELRILTPEALSLRCLEGSRHIIGWCANSTDMCGRPTAGLNVGASGLLKPPASIVIDRLYIEGGNDIVGGVNMFINKKEQPFSLARENDYPSLLKWASLQLIIFYDVSDRRAWLVDGASALLHLVRISLYVDEHDPESTYDWVFDPKRLKDSWDGCTGRQAALKTLKNWDNLELNLNIVSKRLRDQQPVTEYSTLGTRVKKILHTIEILIDRQVKVASQDGIRIPQTLDARKSIAGFDILDVITPLGPVHPRIQHIDSWGPGWRDLVPAVGITTIFGSGFGDLICPDDPSTVCSEWRSVPTGMDYMAASVSTLRMLQERRLARMDPGLGVGELTRKIVWLSPCEPLKSCECVGASQALGACHRNPVQFLMSKRPWNPMLMSRPMAPVDVMTLGGAGAIIFGHMPLLGLGRDGKDRGRGEEERKRSVMASSSSTQGSGEGRMLSASAANSTTASTLTQPSTVITTYDDEDEGGGEGRGESSAGNARRGSRKWRKRWKRWKKST